MPVSLTSLPLPVRFGLFGLAAGVFVALTVGEIVWWLSGPLYPPDPEPPAPPAVSAPALQLAVTVSPKVTVYPGETNTLAVRVARAGFDGAVSVTFGPTPELSAAESTLAAGTGSGTIALAASPTTKPGVYQGEVTARATADGQAVTARATVEVRVVALPGPLPRLAVSTSPRLRAYRRGTNTFAVRVARGEFDEAVSVSFDDLPDGVKVPPVTIPAGLTEATGTLTVESAAPSGVWTATATARAGAGGRAFSAGADAVLDVLARPKVPVDVVFVLDCTGSMKKTVAGVSAEIEKFADTLLNADADVRFGLVGFQDTTLGQPLKIPRLGTERMSARPLALSAAMKGLRLGGGGGEGESSLDGLAEAADCPLRTEAVRVLVLVTDGGPKRSDGRMKSAEETIKYLKAKKIDQLQVVALPEHRKHFEPLWDGAKGKYFDLKAASEADAFGALMGDVAKAIAEAVPAPVLEPVDPGDPAPKPILPQVGAVERIPLPAGAEPAEPQCERATEKPAEPPVEVPSKAPDGPAGRGLARVVWALVVVVLVCGALAVGQIMFLPGAGPRLGPTAVGYGGGIIVGLLVGAAGYGAFDLVGVPFLGRIVGAGAFGLSVGLNVGLNVPPAARLTPVRTEVPQPLVGTAAPAADAPGKSEPGGVPHKPNIAPPKPPDGCPGCGRTIPGTPGGRYCMLCDRTF